MKNERTTACPDIELQDLIPEFLQNRHKELPMLEIYIRDHDFEAIRKLGHTLKGICASFGFKYLGVLGLDLEKAAEAHNTQRVTEIFEEMKNHLNNVEIVYTQHEDL